MRRSSTDEIRRLAREADAESLRLLERTLEGDTRKGVLSALAQAHKRLDAEQAEAERIASMYAVAEELASGVAPSVVEPVAIGLDEVGRGSMAGPLAVGAVILPMDDPIAGLNDSKKLSPEEREILAAQIRERAIAWHVEYIDPRTIDDIGITASLKRAFRGAVQAVEEQGVRIDAILLDGNPLHLDEREANIVKGDARCAPIAAASIVAKVERDALMTALSNEYPQYGFDSNKGYGTEAHRSALAEHGLSDIHRKSFCMEFLQSSLF